MRLSPSLLLISFVSAYAQTAPPQASGYNLVFSDEFDSSHVSPTGTGSYTWYPGIWWERSLPLPSLITDSNSALNLTWSTSGGMYDTSISGLSRDGTQGHTFRYGYFEARMKWDVTTGSWPAFWMVPKQGMQGATDTGEIDIFEGQGSQPFTYFGTLHEWNGTTEIRRNSPNWVNLPISNDFSQWHTYGLLWVPGKVTWYYDNQALFSSNTTSVFDAQDFFVVLSMYEGANWTKGNMTGVTASNLNLSADWVRVWQSGTTTSSSGSHGRSTH
jgi:beta-glucanase (GH16 family)